MKFRNLFLIGLFLVAGASSFTVAGKLSYPPYCSYWFNATTCTPGPGVDQTLCSDTNTGAQCTYTVGPGDVKLAYTLPQTGGPICTVPLRRPF